MKVLIAPMAAMAETSGPFSRSKALAEELRKKGHELALCAAEEINYRPIDGVKNYVAPIPMVMGLPEPIAKKMLKAAQSLGIQQKKQVRSFEQVLFIAGAVQEKFFAKDIAVIREAIRNFQPDIVYAEFRLTALAAARLEGVLSATGYSYPVQKTYACQPKFSKDARRYMKEIGLPGVDSILELFRWADLRIVPSSRSLEPIEEPGTIFTGPLGTYDLSAGSSGSRKNIVVYMGTGAVSYKKQMEVLQEAFYRTEYQVYIASYQADAKTDVNIHTDKRFDFGKLLPDACAFINHGGQNSMMAGLVYGVPQIVFPGNVFERQYNAGCVAAHRAGVQLEDKAFSSDILKKTVADFEKNAAYRSNALALGRELLGLGGVQSAVSALEGLYSQAGSNCSAK